MTEDIRLSYKVYNINIYRNKFETIKRDTIHNYVSLF